MWKRCQKGTSIGPKRFKSASSHVFIDFGVILDQAVFCVFFARPMSAPRSSKIGPGAPKGRFCCSAAAAAAGGWFLARRVAGAASRARWSREKNDRSSWCKIWQANLYVLLFIEIYKCLLKFVDSWSSLFIFVEIDRYLMAFGAFCWYFS